MDDLMVNCLQLHIDAWDVMLKEYNHSIDELPEKMAHDFMGRRVSEIGKEIIDFYKIDVNYEEFMKKRNQIFLDLIKKDLPLMPGFLETVQLVKEKYKIALTTSSLIEYSSLVIEKLNLSDFFDVVVTGEDVSKGKPDPEPYAITAEKLNILPNQCLVLEDAWNGIDSAKAAGCKCIAVENPFTPKQDLSKADKIISSLHDLTLDMINTI